jgi:hypothetical protein
MLGRSVPHTTGRVTVSPEMVKKRAANDTVSPLATVGAGGTTSRPTTWATVTGPGSVVIAPGDRGMGPNIW